MVSTIVTEDLAILAKRLRVLIGDRKHYRVAWSARISRSYLSKILSGSGEGVRFAVVESILKAIGATWTDYDRALIEDQS